MAIRHCRRDLFVLLQSERLRSLASREIEKRGERVREGQALPKASWGRWCCRLRRLSLAHQGIHDERPLLADGLAGGEAPRGRYAEHLLAVARRHLYWCSKWCTLLIKQFIHGNEGFIPISLNQESMFACPVSQHTH